MARNQVAPPLTSLSLAILMALLDGERHGYGLMKAVAAQSGCQIRPGAGSLYEALDRMARSGWILEREATVDGASQRRFAIAPAGRKLARAELERLAALVRVAKQNKLLPEGA
ncbi:MAG: PadR family transcriptional regulator [Longimicrobiales bacterium]